MVAYQLLLFPGEQSDHRINYVVVVDTCSCEIIGSTVRHKYYLSLTQTCLQLSIQLLGTTTPWQHELFFRSILHLA